MLPAIGLVVLLVMVFGGFIISGGDIGVVLHALPLEMMIIGGAGVAAMTIGNNGRQLKAFGGGFVKVFKGPVYQRQDYLDCMFLCSRLLKVLKAEGPVALEPHVEEPTNSAIFAEYPRLLANQTLTALICDSLRLVVVSSADLDPHSVEEVIDQHLRTHHKEALGPADNLQWLADALPALGIVAAVLGVVKTMGAIDQPPEILGGMIGSALVGTFLGVLLAYGMVGPIANRLRAIIEEDHMIFTVAKQIIVATLHGHPQPLVIEAARASLTHPQQPSFADVFDGLRGR